MAPEQETDRLRAELLRRRLASAAKKTATPVVTREGLLPLSYSQRRLWFLDRLNPGSPEYLVPILWRLRGALDPDALRTALADLVARHEILRTRYELVGADPVQRVDPVGLDFELTDATAVQDEAWKPFDLATEHPFRVRLVRLSDDEHLLAVVFHHIACDGWSAGVFTNELSALYRKELLPPLDFQYADYAIRERDRLTPQVREKHLDYWRDQLAGVRPVTLPADRPRPPIREPAGDLVEFTVPADRAEALRELARRQGATLFMVLVTAVQVQLARYSGRADVVVGTPVADRQDFAVRNLIGPFLNTVVLRAKWVGDPSFAELLADGRDTVLDAFDHQELPFDLLVRDLEPDHDLSRNPLFEVMVEMQSASDGGPALPGVRVEPVDLAGRSAKFDLTVHVSEQPDGSLRGWLEFATALFDWSTVDRIGGHLCRLLDQIAADPDIRVSEVDILGEAELAVVGGHSPAAWAERQPLPCVHQVFEAQAARTPDAIAVVSEDVESTYAELNAAANRLAHLLLAAGVGPGSLVGVCLDRGPDLVPTLLGVLKSGAGYLPLDPEQPLERRRFMLADAGVDVVVTSAGQAPSLRAVYQGTTIVLTDIPADLPAANPPISCLPEDPAYLIYTSGSTGRPKGVPVSHANVVRLFEATEEELRAGPADVWTLFHSYAFDFSVWELWGALLSGGRLVVVPRAVTRAPEDFLELLVRHQVTVLSQTPSAFRGLVALAASGDERLARLALRTVVFGGEKLVTGELAPWIERFGFDRPVLLNMYGITEITVHATCHRLTRADLTTGLGSPIGKPLADLWIRLLDEQGRLAPIGVPGEIHVGGAGVALGYLNRPGLTAARFVPDSSGPPGARLYRSGDLALRTADGNLWFLGRADDQVKIRGYRIEPGEIETALMAHPDIREAAVVPHTDSAGARLVGYLVPATTNLPGTVELREWLARTLPEYMVPAVFLPLSRIPLTANGKRNLAALPRPGRTALGAGRGHVAPATPLQRRIAAIWSEILGVDVPGVHDTFFDLGGDSIRAVGLVGALRDAGFAVTVRDLFEHRTVSALSALLAANPVQAAEVTPVAPFELLSGDDRAKLPAGVVDAYPLSQVQVGMVYELLAAAGAGSYHNVTALRITDPGPFSLAALEAASNLVVGRHEILRTSIDMTSYSLPLQLVRPAADMAVTEYDLTTLTAVATERELRRFMAEEKEKPFDLSSPPLLRLSAHRGNGEWWLVLTECHAILEGWSLTSMIMEVLDVYRSLRRGDSPAPAELPAVRYADFIAAERESLHSDADREFWRGLLAGHAKFALPAAWAGQPDQAGPLHQVVVEYQDLVPALRALATRADASLKSVLHTAHLKVMSMLTEERAFCTGLVCDGRPEVTGADRVYGMYLNVVPFPFRLSSDTWVELVKDVFATELELWPHRRYPLPEMHRVLAGGHRLVDVFFNYLDFHRVDRDLIDFQGSIDDSPNEFALSATTHPGQFLLTTRSESISPANTGRLARMYRLVLEAMAADPDGSALGTHLPDGEYAAMTGAWNATAEDYPSQTTLGELVAAQAEATPDAVALVDADGGTVSYAELNRRANQLAHYLRKLGVAAESFVGVCFDHSVEMFVGLLGVLKSGGAYVPLDPTHPADRLAFVLADTGARVLVTEQRLLPALPAYDSQVVCLDRDRAIIEGYPGSEPVPVAEAGNLVYAMYTSGSTGRPKGVLITHRALINYLAWSVHGYGLGGAQGAPMIGSIAFDLSVPNFFLPLVGGRSVTLLRPDPHLGALAELIRAPGDFSLAKITPAHLDMLRTQLPPDTVVDSVRTFVVGADELRPETVLAWRRIAPAARIINEYGPTETVVGCSVYEIDADFDPAVAVSIGRPIANIRMYVLDEFLNPVPVGVVGELYIAGDGVARGYLGRPALTAEKFVPDPFTAGGRCYRTGDLARFRPDGNLDFLGRIDHQVKVRGYRIELGEIEARLVLYPAVSEAVVVAREDRPGDKRLVGYVVAHQGQDLSPARLREWLAERLPDYLVPSLFVVLDALPLSSGGKVDRSRLPEPRPDATRSVDAAPPQGPAERLLAGIWRDLLGLDEVGVHEDFFALGGYSLLMAQLVARIRAAVGVDVSLRRLFSATTIAAQAVVVDESGTMQAPPITAMPPGARIPLAFSQESLWELEQQRPGTAENIAVEVLPLTAEVDLAVLRAALGALADRHAALRTRYRVDEHGPRQEVVAAAVVDLAESALPIAELVNTEISRGFDLAEGPVWRARVVRTTAGAAALVLVVHRLAADGWSMVIMARELRVLYAALLAGRPSPLDPLALSYADIAHWQRTWLTDAALAEQVGHWRWTLAGLRRLELPTDRPRPAVRDASGASCPLLVPADVVERIERLGREHGATLFMTLLAAFTAVLARHGNSTDVAVGVPVANRALPETHALVGFLLNTVVVRTDLSGEPDFAELLGRVRAAALSAFARQDMPFHRLAAELDPHPDPARAPLVDVLFTLHEAGSTGLDPVPDLPAGEVTQAAKADLALVAQREADGTVTASLDFATALFNGDTVAGLAADLLALLTSIGTADQPEIKRPTTVADGIAECIAQHAVPGVSFALLRGGEIAEVAAHGVVRAGGLEPVVADTVFQAGSVSKQITAIAALRLAGQGQLDLDADVHDRVASLGVPVTSRETGPVTVRMLLNHTAGPGRTFRYSGSHYTVVEQLLADLTGRPFEELVTELVLAPLGMTDSSFDPAFPTGPGRRPAVGHDVDGIPLRLGWHILPEKAAAGLWTTAADLAKAAREIHRAYRGESTLVLGTEQAKQLLTDPGSGYGLGSIVDSNGPVFGHPGTSKGYRCLSVVDASSGNGMVVMTNGDNGNEVVDWLGATLGLAYGPWLRGVIATAVDR